MKKPTQIPLPNSPLDSMGTFWRYNGEFIDELSSKLHGLKILEVFAGNGYLAALLAQRGIEVVATSIFSSMDAHWIGVYHPVIEMDAIGAVTCYGAQCDILLMCWPTTHRHAHLSAVLWTKIKRFQPNARIIFIGEFTDYSKNHLGGCATDEFFESFVVDFEFKSYEGNCMEKACMGRMADVRIH